MTVITSQFSLWVFGIASVVGLVWLTTNCVGKLTIGNREFNFGWGSKEFAEKNRPAL